MFHWAFSFLIVAIVVYLTLRRRIKMLNRSLVVAGSIGLMVGCATVPDDAPQEFHDAEASIERMDDNDVDEYFPKSAERANESFDKALDLLEESREDEAKVTSKEAIAKAVEARENADGANRLFSAVRKWDDSAATFQDALVMFDELENPSVDVTVVNSVSPFAKLQNTEFVSTVAYFDSGKTEPSLNENELEALVGILEKDINFQVILTGHSDSRGDEAYNQKLALTRAQKIASNLEKRGVSRNQVIIESVGEEGAIGEVGNMARLQLDRKVQAKVILQ